MLKNTVSNNNINEIIEKAKKIKTTKALLEFIKPDWTLEYGWIAECDKPFFEKYINADEDICKLIENRKGVDKDNYTDKLCSVDELIELWKDKNNKYKGTDEKWKYQNRAKLFTDLYPVQIIGDIENAKVFLMNMNPSMDENNISEEIELNKKGNKEHIDQYKKNATHSFYFLNNKYKETGAYKWWTNGHHFKQWIKWTKEEFKKNEQDALEILSKCFCEIEAVPYHARYLTEKINSHSHLKQLPSFLAIKSYLQNNILTDPNKVIIYLRKAEDFQIDLNNTNNNSYITTNYQKGYFGRNSKKNEWQNAKEAIENAIKNTKIKK